MDKVIRDGKVAVLYSPGFGAGWYSWHCIKPLLFDPFIVELVEKRQSKEIDEKTCGKLIKEYCKTKYPDAYIGGADDLTISWIPEETSFRIDEYDGSESIRYRDNTDWIVA